MWRRAAIAEAGGWSGQSLLEDLDVSLRAFAGGWTAINLVTVSVVGELPETAAALLSVLPGYILQLALLGPEAVDGVPEALRSLWPS